MPLLVVEKGRDRGRTWHIDPDGDCLIGRDRTCRLRLHDPMTSRRHFRITGDGERYQIEDLGSRNGTYLNGRKVLEDFIQIEDKVRVGETIISLLKDEEARNKGPLTGTTVEGYLFRERIGRGGMGTVYRARQLSLDRPVAVKVLAPELTEDREFVDLFLREARAAGKLNHPNVVKVYDVVEKGTLHFYSMELVEGGSVEEALARDGPFPAERALEIAFDAARALEYAEKRGLIHRDIKPGNLMITSTGEVKICDLGIAKTLAEAASTIEIEGISGSPHYMAPEQGTGRPIDHRADIYSLGVSLYEMLAGEPPFVASTAGELIRMHMSEPPPSIREKRPEVPPAVDRILGRMLAKKPSDRFENAGALSAELDRSLSSISGRPPKVPPPPPERPSPLRAVVLASLLLLIGIPLAVHARGKRREAAARWDTERVSVQEGSVERMRQLVGKGRFDEARAIAEAFLAATDGEIRAIGKSTLEEIALEERRRKTVRLAEAAFRHAVDHQTIYPEDLEGVREILQGIDLSGGERPDLAEEVDRRIAALDEAIAARDAASEKESARLRERAAVTQAAISDVDAALADGDFGAASERVRRLRTDRPDLAEEADILERKVADAAREAWRAAKVEVERLVEAGDLEGAAGTLRRVHGGLPEETMRAEATALLGEVERRIEEEEREREAAVNAADRARYKESFAKAGEHARAMDLAEALHVLRDGRDSLSGAAYRKNFDVRIAHLERIVAVLGKIRQRVEDDPAHRLTTLHTDGRNWEIVGVDDQGLLIRDAESGQAEFKKRWALVGWQEIRRIYRRMGPLSASDHLCLYALCREYQPLGSAARNERKDAEALLEAAPEPEVEEAFRDYDTHGW